MKLERWVRVLGLLATAGLAACDCMCGSTPAASTVFGTVLDADDGAPVCGARVEVRVVAPSAYELAPDPTAEQVTQSDASGSFELSGLPGPSLEIVATDGLGRTGFVRLPAGGVRNRLEVVLHVRAP